MSALPATAESHRSIGPTFTGCACEADVPGIQFRFSAATATVVRASALRRLMTHVAGYLELTELYEVSFSDGRAS